MTPASWSVSAESSVRTGEQLRVVVALELEPGWHINGCRPSSPTLIPTAFFLPDGSPFSLVGPPVESAPVWTAEPGSFEQIAVHEGKAQFDLALQSPSEPGSYELVVEVRAQLCSDHTCLPPALTTVRAEQPVVVA